MTTTGYVALVLVLCTVFLGSVAGIGWLSRRRERPVQSPELEPIIEERSAARDARDEVLSKAVLLAVEMARVDGFIAPKEMDAIRDFIVGHVKRADDVFAARMMRQGIDEPAGPAAVDAAVSRIREIGTPELTDTVARLLVFVAVADGVLCPEEIAFFERVGAGLGLPDDEIRSLLRSAGS